MENILQELLEAKEEKYKEFMQGLLPTVDRDTVIGVRMPRLRKIAKRLIKNGHGSHFLCSLPHKYYEENLIHALIISELSDVGLALSETERFLPFVDNWGVCDSLRPRSFSPSEPQLIEKIKLWIKSDRTYVARFAIEMLMLHFLDDGFRAEYLDAVAAVRTNEYYLNMMVGWYFATALAKRYGEAVRYIEERRLSPVAHAMAIRKSVESRRIDEEKKAYLKTLRL